MPALVSIRTVFVDPVLHVYLAIVAIIIIIIMQIATVYTLHCRRSFVLYFNIAALHLRSSLCIEKQLLFV